MTRLLIGLIALIGLGTPAHSRVDLSYYLPEGTTYDPDIPTPEAFFGFQIGDWHLRHDLIVNYMHTLAERSDRIVLTQYAQTHQQRPLLLLTITSPQNHPKPRNHPDTTPATHKPGSVARARHQHNARGRVHGI